MEGGTNHLAVVAGIIFILMYAVIVSEKIHRTVAAMLGALLMILSGILSQDTALHHIDFNTLGLLVGMMVLVGVGTYAYRREDGVYVVPIGCLKD